MPTALIITTAGTNCDRELGRAFERAGASVEFVHLNTLIRRPQLVDRFGLIGLPGGFSYGDAIAAGRIAATLMRRHLHDALTAAIDRGVPIIAPCNGFQVAVQMGLLPGPAPGAPRPSAPSTPVAALGPNAQGRFVDRWSRVMVPAETRCIWTSGMAMTPGTDLLPVAHAEGRFIAGDGELIPALAANGQIAVRYAADDNPNGSEGDIAGICDATGLVFGLMPHPERYTRWTQHPAWTRLDETQRRDDPPGLAMFKRAVAHANEHAAVSAGR